MKHRFVENGSRVYEDCARKKKKEEKPREDLDSAVELHEMCGLFTWDFFLRCFYTKKVRSGNESK